MLVVAYLAVATPPYSSVRNHVRSFTACASDSCGKGPALPFAAAVPGTTTAAGFTPIGRAPPAPPSLALTRHASIMRLRYS